MQPEVKPPESATQPPAAAVREHLQAHGALSYSPPAGRRDLRAAIAAQLSARWSTEVAPDDVLVTHGNAGARRLLDWMSPDVRVHDGAEDGQGEALAREGVVIIDMAVQLGQPGAHIGALVCRVPALRAAFLRFVELSYSCVDEALQIGLLSVLGTAEGSFEPAPEPAELDHPTLGDAARMLLVRGASQTLRSIPAATGAGDRLPMGFGEVRFPMPALLQQAIAEPPEAAPEGEALDAAVRERVAEMLRTARSIDVEADALVLGMGSKALQLSYLQAFMDEAARAGAPAVQLILPAPRYPSWEAQARFVATRSEVAVSIEELAIPYGDGFKLRPALLAERLASLTDTPEGTRRLLVLGSPGNPSGQVYSEAEVEALRDCCREHGVWLLADELYAMLVYDGGRQESFAARAEDTHFAMSGGISKEWCAGGLRVGWLLVRDPELRASLRAHVEHFAPDATSLRALWGALADPAAFGRHLCKLHGWLAPRRSRLEELLEEVGLDFLPNAGGLYLFPYVGGLYGRRLGAHVLDAHNTAQAIAEHCGVTAQDGAVFGCPGFLRLSFALRELTEVDDAVRRLRQTFALLVDDAPQAERRPPYHGGAPSRAPQSEAEALPRSRAYLERLYAGDFQPREKKPMVVDHRASEGVFIGSVECPPHQILDGMAQISTMPMGFSAPALQAKVRRGELDGGLANHISARRAWTAQSLSFVDAVRPTLPLPLRRGFVPVASGAEGVETALSICAYSRPGARRVIAFEGSFHGRTLLALAASYNPVKRAPYEFEGYTVDFVPFPHRGLEPDHSAPDPGGDTDDALLNAERESLAAIEAQIRDGEGGPGTTLAMVTEPMLSEGGDLYGTTRFFRALRRLTLKYGVPMALDETQTGFGLTGPVWASAELGFDDGEGAPVFPEVLSVAKRSQAGAVFTSLPVPHAGDSCLASLQRGAEHLRYVADPARRRHVEGLGDLLRMLLRQGAAHLPEGTLTNIRGAGGAVAFDLPDGTWPPRIVKQRFWRGFMVYPCGSHTLRARLTPAMEESDVFALAEMLLEAVRVAASDEEVPAWEPGHIEAPVQAKPRPDDTPLRIEDLRRERWPEVVDAVMAIENAAYEPVRRDSREDLEAIALAEDAVVLLGWVPDGEGEKLAGFAFADPVENHPRTHGPDRDPERGEQTTIYAFDLTIDPAQQGRGIGRRLKDMQVRIAARMRREDGSPRYLYMTGRNRVGSDAVRVLRMVEARGGEVAMHLRGDDAYGTPSSEALYYRLPLRRVNGVRHAGAACGVHVPAPGQGFEQSAERLAQALGRAPGPEDAREIPFVPALERSRGAFLASVDRDSHGRHYGLYDLGAGNDAPLGYNPPRVVESLVGGRFDGAALNKLTLSNFVTPAYVHYLSRMRRLAPAGLGHFHLTSSLAEAVDKAIKCLRYHRKSARWVGSFTGAWHGMVSAAARTLSWWPESEHGRRRHFDDWPYLPFPGDGGVDENGALDAIASIIEERGGGEHCAGIFIEPWQLRRARSASRSFYAGLRELTARYEVPLVFDETATGFGRTGTRWAVEGLELPAPPDLVIQGVSGQLGGVWVNDRYYIEKPLQLISTWDGDEVSLIRAGLCWDEIESGQLWTRAEALGARMGSALGRIDGIEARGQGLLWGFQAPSADARASLQREALGLGVLLGLAGDRGVYLAPPLTIDEAELDDALARLSRAVEALR